jgi:hypothetical protein
MSSSYGGSAAGFRGAVQARTLGGRIEMAGRDKRPEKVLRMRRRAFCRKPAAGPELCVGGQSVGEIGEQEQIPARDSANRITSVVFSGYWSGRRRSRMRFPKTFLGL